MGEVQQTIAVAGATPFAFVLAGLLAADHGRKVYVVAQPPAFDSVPPQPSFSIWPTARPDTLQIVSSNAPEVMRRIGRIAPEAIERTDVVVRADTVYYAEALSHFRHLANGFGHVVERVADAANSEGLAVRIRDVTRLSPAPFLTGARAWAARIGIEWIEDPRAITVRRNGIAQFGELTLDRLVLADDDAIATHLPANVITPIGTFFDQRAYIAEPGHGVIDPQFFLPDGTQLSPLRGGALSIHVDNGDGRGDARAASHLPEGVRRAATRRYRHFRTHDGAPALGNPKGSRLYLAAGFGALDVALAPVVARHICGEAQGLEAEWCAMHAAMRAMAGSMVADIAPEACA